jgi:dipeptidyl aminopeptidase/acylaminoacyl peptidase
MRKVKYLLLIFILILGIFFITNVLGKRDPVTPNSPAKSSSVRANNYVSPISVDYLRTLDVKADGPSIEQELEDGSNYKRYIASYYSEGNKIYGLLTVPKEEMPNGGFSAIVFCHGYIPPQQYVTTQGYAAYVDELARNGFVVFKIDYRGNGNSEGDPTGSYFSSGYTIDAISALRSLQKFEKVNPQKIGIWGHSMAGNLVLRAMEVTPDFKAGVIWSGAVYSYKDFATYGINDSSYVHRPETQKQGAQQKDREVSPEIQKIRTDPKSINFEDPFWTTISLTKNLKYLKSPLQINQAVNDPVVNIGYSRDLADALKANGNKYEFYEYDGGGHNIVSPYFETAMQRTVSFFRENL